jgi:hypothetical protein
MLDLLGPAYHDAVGSRLTKIAMVILERYGNPVSLRRLGQRRLATLAARTSGGNLGESFAADLIAAADQAIALWAGGGLDFEELAWDLASEIRIIGQLDTEIDRLDTRSPAWTTKPTPKDSSVPHQVSDQSWPAGSSDDSAMPTDSPTSLPSAASQA